MVLFVGDRDGILFIGKSGMELFCFVVSVSSAVGRYVLLFDCITSGLSPRDFCKNHADFYMESKYLKLHVYVLVEVVD